MKQKIHLKVLLLAMLALFGATYTYAGSGHDDSAHSHAADGGHSHGAAEHKSEGGPNGGRLITIVDPHLEFLVTPERLVQITFLGHDGEVVPAGEQVVSAIGGKRSAPTKVTFVKKEGRLISTEALPAMKNMPIILHIKATPEAKSVRETFYLNMSDCPGCDFKEYACICGH